MRFWVLEPDEGKPSSPVLRGLGASNDARLLDPVGLLALLFFVAVGLIWLFGTIRKARSRNNKLPGSSSAEQILRYAKKTVP